MNVFHLYNKENHLLKRAMSVDRDALNCYYLPQALQNKQVNTQTYTV